MHIDEFAMGEQLDLEEALRCEFKEVKNQPPVKAIGEVTDRYVVAFLNADGGSVFLGDQRSGPPRKGCETARQ